MEANYELSQAAATRNEIYNMISSSTLLLSADKIERRLYVLPRSNTLKSGTTISGI